IAVLESLLDKADAFIIGGGMAYTFLKEQGKTVGKSLVENEYADTAHSFLDNAARRGVSILLPRDHIVADEFIESAKPELIDDENIPDGKIAMDIGPKTISEMKKLIANAGTVVWNGPMGVFEFDAFSQGTLELAKTVADCHGMTVLGGGDSVAAVNKFNLSERIDHVSTGGGASLEYLEGRVLPGIAALNEE
ncbi:MAG: phosphoglycerate kinase, partial [spirochete symbiont of Stewartia floridana]